MLTTTLALLSLSSLGRDFDPPGRWFTYLTDQKDIDAFDARDKAITKTYTFAEYGKPWIDAYNRAHSAIQPALSADMQRGSNAKGYFFGLPLIGLTPMKAGFTVKCTFHHWGTPDDPPTVVKYFKTNAEFAQKPPLSPGISPEHKYRWTDYIDVVVISFDPKADFKIVDDSKVKRKQ